MEKIAYPLTRAWLRQLFQSTCVVCGKRKPKLTAMCDECFSVHEGDM